MEPARNGFDDLPKLEDGTVLFEMLVDYQRHFRAFIHQSALLVRTQGVEIGQKRRLTLHVQELDVEVAVEGTAEYRNDQLVGFRLEVPETLADRLQEIAADSR